MTNVLQGSCTDTRADTSVAYFIAAEHTHGGDTETTLLKSAASWISVLKGMSRTRLN